MFYLFFKNFNCIFDYFSTIVNTFSSKYSIYADTLNVEIKCGMRLHKALHISNIMLYLFYCSNGRINLNKKPNMSFMSPRKVQCKWVQRHYLSINNLILPIRNVQQGITFPHRWRQRISCHILSQFWTLVFCWKCIATVCTTTE